MSTQLYYARPKNYTIHVTKTNQYTISVKNMYIYRCRR